MRKVLWAPWRAEYIRSFDEKPAAGCIFCTYPKQKKDKSNLILARKKGVFVIMNRFPYNNGHLMVVPYRHTGDPCRLSTIENKELWETVLQCKTILGRLFKPAGFNIGMNLGRCAGAGIDKHCHLHIVPRWNGDTNFMPLFGEVKVVSESLLSTYRKLLPFFKERL